LSPQLVPGAEDDLSASSDQVPQFVLGDLLEQGEAAEVRCGDHIDAR
jgi:hypothetical protein